MNQEKINQVNFILHVFANKYMTRFIGDILLTHSDIINTLENRGEIELYLSTCHFDSENRFNYAGTCEDCRLEARKQQWGDYIVTLFNRKDGITFGVENGCTSRFVKEFPMETLLNDGDIWNIKCEFDKTSPINLDFLRRHGNYNYTNENYVVTFDRPLTFSTNFTDVTTDKLYMDDSINVYVINKDGFSQYVECTKKTIDSLNDYYGFNENKEENAAK